MNIQSTQSSGCLCVCVFVCVAGMALSLATLLHFSSVTSSSTLWDSWAGGEKGWLREGNRGAAPPPSQVRLQIIIDLEDCHLSTVGKPQICKRRKTQQKRKRSWLQANKQGPRIYCSKQYTTVLLLLHYVFVRCVLLYAVTEEPHHLVQMRDYMVLNDELFISIVTDNCPQSKIYYWHKVI